MRSGRFQEAFNEMMKDVYTSVTGHLLAFDPNTQLAQVQVGVVSKDTEGNSINPSPIIECPVQFSGGADWSIECELNPNDEGLIVFSQRCLDGWKQTGGIANNPIARFHDKQDACFIPGIRSKKTSISNFQNDGVRIRNSDASIYHWVKSDGTIESKNDSASHTVSSSGSVESVNSAGYIKLLASGVVDINGFIISPVGAAVSPISVSAPSVIAGTSLTVAGAEQAGHKHLPGTYAVGNNSVTGESGEQS